MLSRTYSFQSGAPTKQDLEDLLRSRTGLWVEVKDASEEGGTITCEPQTTALEEWEVAFRSPLDDYSEVVLCNRDLAQLCIVDFWEDLNRCPHYPFFATAGAIEDLGGKQESSVCERCSRNSLPDYSRLSFVEWKVRNRGTKPPKWKYLVVLVKFGAQIITMLATFPFKCASALSRSLRSHRNYGRKVATVERMGDQTHLARHLKFRRGKPNSKHD